MKKKIRNLINGFICFILGHIKHEVHEARKGEEQHWECLRCKRYLGMSAPLYGVKYVETKIIRR